MIVVMISSRSLFAIVALAAAAGDPQVVPTWHPQGPIRRSAPPRATTFQATAAPPPDNGAMDAGAGRGAMRDVVARGGGVGRRGPLWAMPFK
jgi:hypothetical protein